MSFIKKFTECLNLHSFGHKKCEVFTERLLHTRCTFDRSLVVLVDVSKLIFTSLIYVELGVKVDCTQY